MTHREAIENTYTDSCSIYNFEDATEGSLTRQQEVAVYVGIPCRVSFSAISPAEQKEGTVTKQMTVKLFIAPEIEVKSGSKIVVERNGERISYSRSGQPAKYESHQEIMLQLQEHT